MRPLDEQVILVTGATDGLGRGRPRWYRADLASLADVRALAERVAAEEPRLDVLVNNAGIATTLSCAAPATVCPGRPSPVRDHLSGPI